MQKDHVYHVYIMASKTGTLYIGVSSDLEKRVQQHKQGAYEGFSKKYGCNRLVYYEETNDIRCAIEREKQLKRWRREKKIKLIERCNSQWNDLSLNL